MSTETMSVKRRKIMETPEMEKVYTYISKVSTLCALVQKRCDEIYNHGERMHRRSSCLLKSVKRGWDMNCDLTHTIKSVQALTKEKQTSINNLNGEIETMKKQMKCLQEDKNREVERSQQLSKHVESLEQELITLKQLKSSSSHSSINSIGYNDTAPSRSSSPILDVLPQELTSARDHHPFWLSNAYHKAIVEFKEIVAGKRCMEPEDLRFEDNEINFVVIHF